MMQDKVYRLLASSIDAHKRCIETKNSEWEVKHKKSIEQLVDDLLPSGSGWDNGTTFDFDNSTGEKLVLYGSFHHMNENGYYDGWTDHRITVKPSLIHGITMSISGINRNDIKEYLYDIFSYSLTQDIWYDDTIKAYRPMSVQNAVPNPFKDVPADIFERAEANLPR